MFACLKSKITNISLLKTKYVQTILESILLFIRSFIHHTRRRGKLHKRPENESNGIGVVIKSTINKSVRAHSRFTLKKLIPSANRSDYKAGGANRRWF